LARARSRHPPALKAARALRRLEARRKLHPRRPCSACWNPDFRRIDYLTYDKMQARWEYVSMDTRAPIGIMSAAGLGSQAGAEITVYFDGFATPGMGLELEGRFVRARHVDTRENGHHAFKRQFWTQPGQKEWLAVQYEYTRSTR
jgi:hypothetical protein